MPTPTVNQPVLLSGEGGEFASRVEDVTDGALTLARPFGLPLDTRLDEGVPFDVQWTDATGLYTMPAKVTERAVDGKIRVWHAQPIGPVRTANRRAHVRVSVALPIVLGVDGTRIEASLLDVSEAALRCQVDKPLPRPRTSPEDPDTLVTDAAPAQKVTVAFTLGGTDFTLDGALFRSTPTRSVVELVITLPEDERTATSVRRAVFAEQIRARQLSR